jgi:hypothetical protein
MSSDQLIFDRYYSWLVGAADWGLEIEKAFPDFDFDVDHAILYQAAKSYRNDIERFKAFHLAEEALRADATKKAAFTLYWIARLRPIRVRPKVGYADPKAVLVAAGKDPSSVANVGYAFAMIWPYLGYRLSPLLQSHLIYLLTYRTLTGEALLSFFNILDTIRTSSSAAFADVPKAT